jgi:hypothetical protein
MDRVFKSVRGRAAPLLLVLVAGAGLYACGGSGDSGAEELARQQELRAARVQAAEDARQSAKIGELERRLRKRHSEPSAAAPVTAPSTPSVPVAADPSPLGIWKGEAVISYDDGKSDPFFQTVQLDSLQPGKRAGYSEAQQGSTTCHGPLTYQGEIDGWYSFNAEEQNVAECIDYSQLELRIDELGGMEYRETTDISVSEGTLQRVG